MKTKHTPGEWFQSHRKIPNDPYEMYSTQVYTEDGEEICSLAWYPKPKKKTIIDGKTVLITGTYRDANAKLIAAAPDLLAMCIKTSNINSIAREHISESFFEELRKVIQKAIS